MHVAWKEQESFTSRASHQDHYRLQNSKQRKFRILP